MLKKNEIAPAGRIWGGVEAGGTKFVCAVGSGPADIRDRTVIPTTRPDETLDRVTDFFKTTQKRHGFLHGLGIACFGPVELNPASPTYGSITTTPKPGWGNTDVLGPLRERLGVPAVLDTDVNVAALGEGKWGAAQGLDTFVYITVGTGLGGGAVVGGRLLHGLIHPEMGHMRIPRNPNQDPFTGACPFHGDCLEGLAAGPALEQRWGRKGQDLDRDHPAWPLEAHYLALGLVNLICVLSPQRIILGGGVMNNPDLFPLIRREVRDLLNGYVQAPQVLDPDSGFIVPPGLGKNSGILGAIALAQAMEKDGAIPD